MSTLAEYLVQQMAAWGIQRVYGVSGDTFFPLIDAIDKHPQMTFVTVRHEAAAGFMASAEYKLTGRLAACLSTSGPGLGNLLNGLGDAYADKVPVLAITGQVETWKIGTEAKQYIDQQLFIQPLAGYTTLLTTPDAAGQVVPAALRMAVGSLKVAHISVPKDLFDKPCLAQVMPNEPFLSAAPSPNTWDMQTAQQMISAAQRPLILLGHGALKATPQVLAASTQLGAGIIQSLGAKGAVPWSHPLLLGGLGDGGSDASHTALQEADLLLAVGVNWWPKPYVPESLSVIKIDKDPSNIGGSMQVKVGLPGQAESILPQLLQGVTQVDRSSWTQLLQGLKTAWQSTLDQECAPSSPMSPQHIVRAIEQAAPPNAIITLDTGDHTVWFNRTFGGSQHDVLFSGKWRSLGYGLPAALAAKLAAPDRTVFAIVGDGGLQSLLGELTTAAELGLPIIVVVMNNGMMAIEHNRAQHQNLSTLGTMPRNPDFAQVAAACGLTGVKATTPDELAAALQQALTATGPTLIDAACANVTAPTAIPKKDL